MHHPVIKSRKQLIRLWFEFYKLAVADPHLQSDLATSKAFYEPWGDCRGVPFDPWWKEHAYLFGGTKVEEITRVASHPNVLNLSIPLNVPVTQSLPAIKALILERQRARLIEQGIDPDAVKSTTTGFGTYEFTPGEIRGKVLNEALTIYTLWLERGKPAVNSDFCQHVVETLRNRPRSKWIPYILQQAPEPDKKRNLRFTEDQLRQTRRYLKRAEKVCLAVSRGHFPG